MNWRKLLLALGPIPVVGACLLAACGGDSSPTGPGPDGGAAMKDLRGVSVGQNARFAWDERVVTDRETGLVWQRAAEDRWLSWREANER